MELDDVAEKARRNLMMVATGILAVWALGIPLDGKLIGAVNLAAVEPWRAWLCVSLVLVYFALRYHFAPVDLKTARSVEKLQAWKSRRKSQYRTSREGLFKQLLALSTEDGTPRSNGPQMAFRFPARPPGNGMTLLQTGDCLWNGRSGKFPTRWNQLIREKMEGGGMVSVGYQPVGAEEDAEVTINRLVYLRLHFDAWKHAYQPSWNLLELTIPWILATGAFIVCLWRIATSIYYSFPFVRQLLPA
ncbi:hypothetical protein B9P52_31895 [Achromobacter denitrificans]|uniref:hypothetical protein n=1 Tax=Achromobacter denitrificans TaxID=32002 RepID=UPI000B4CC56F|nr:hypothetical protein [Achromobacter denitrificans]ASC68600.1 hypothetical protein B9P52_31895 [Achromobacter denitrificans]